MLVNMLKPNTSKTFADYPEDIFSATIRKEINKFDGIDIIFDRYKKNSGKLQAKIFLIVPPVINRTCQ